MEQSLITQPEEQSEPLADQPKQAKVLAGGDLQIFSIMACLYVAVLIVPIGLAAKFIAIGPFNVNGATLLWPITFIFNDIFCEVYGYSKSRQIIWTGLAAQAFAAFMYWLVSVLPGSAFWHNQIAFDTILGQSPRIVAASLLAYFWGEYANSVIMSKMKYAQHGALGKLQNWRFVLSTIAGEAIDTMIFFPLAFLGTIPAVELLGTMGFVYCFKVGYEILALPGSTRVANWLKAREALDVIDEPATTDYSPMISV